jgi:hypothetical protein
MKLTTEKLVIRANQEVSIFFPVMDCIVFLIIGEELLIAIGD